MRVAAGQVLAREPVPWTPVDLLGAIGETDDGTALHRLREILRRMRESGEIRLVDGTRYEWAGAGMPNG